MNKQRLSEENKKRYLIVTIILIILCIIAAITRYYVITNSYEDAGNLNAYEMKYVLESNNMTLYHSIGIVGIAALILCVAIAIGSKVNRKLESISNGAVFLSVLSGFFLFGTCLFYCYENFASFKPIDYVVNAFLILTAIVIVLNSFNIIKPYSNLQIFLSTLPVIFCIIRLVYQFLMLNEYQNQASNTFYLVSLIAVMLFFVQSGKYACRRGSATFYMFFGMLSVLLLLVYSVPAIILVVTTYTKAIGGLPYYLIDCMFAIYIMSQLLDVHSCFE